MRVLRKHTQKIDRIKLKNFKNEFYYIIVEMNSNRMEYKGIILKFLVKDYIMNYNRNKNIVFKKAGGFV